MLSTVIIAASLVVSVSQCVSYCGIANGGPHLEYVVGDALTDSPTCVGPNGTPYPIGQVRALLPELRGFSSSQRQGRSFFGNSAIQSPEETRKELLHVYSLAKTDRIKQHLLLRSKRQTEEAEEDKNVTSGGGDSNSTTESPKNDKDDKDEQVKKEPAKLMTSSTSCESSSTPARLCKSTFNTTAPMYGVSLTSGKPVTIVQIFPDLLQQVVYETCDSKQCDLIHGECVQTYVPYLFLVIPLGPVTLTGQDYVLVESGCSCRPKYAPPGSDPNPTAIIPNF